jgi:hypothetical protein
MWLLVCGGIVLAVIGFGWLATTSYFMIELITKQNGVQRLLPCSLT